MNTPKLNNVLKNVAIVASGIAIGMVFNDVAFADESSKAVKLDFLEGASDTISEALKGNAGNVISGLMVAGGGYGSFKSSTWTPIAVALASAAAFKTLVGIML